MRTRMFRTVLALAALAASTAALAQQPAAPKREIAPEYREMYEQRQREKQAIASCQRKADLAKVSVRDRAKFVIDCLDHPAAEPASPSGSQRIL